MKSVAEAGKGASDLRGVTGSKIHSAPRTGDTAYLDLFILKKKKDRLEKEENTLKKRKERIQKSLSEIKQETELAEKMAEKEKEKESRKKSSEPRIKSPSKEWHKITLNY